MSANPAYLETAAPVIPATFLMTAAFWAGERAHPLREVLAVRGIAVRPTGPGTLKARCPFHDDREPSLLLVPHDERALGGPESAHEQIAQLPLIWCPRGRPVVSGSGHGQLTLR